MFGFLKKKKVDSINTELVARLEETQARWFAFLNKMEQAMEELCKAAIPELQHTLASDEDPYKRVFLRVQSGINGQMNNIHKKVYDTCEEKITSLFYELTTQYNPSTPEYNMLSDFRDVCSERYHNQFNQKYHYCRTQLELACQQDVEAEYKKILAEFDGTKKFSCSQCGSPLLVEKMFFISTFVACPACQTQNTFEPGTQARKLQYMARELAEQRTAYLLEAYEAERGLERELYQQNHQLKLSLIHENNRQVQTQKEKEIAAIEARRIQSINNAPQLYKKYLRAMYDEWNCIVPDLKAHNEKMYENEVNNIHYPNS